MLFYLRVMPIYLPAKVPPRSQAAITGLGRRRRHITLCLVTACAILPTWRAAAAPLPSHPWFDVREFGAAGDGKRKDTEAIQQAVEAAAQQGGGEVVLTAGRYLSGTITLRSGVTLHVQKGAVLLGSTDLADYPQHQPPVPGPDLEFGRYSLVYAEGAQQVAVEGEGTIDGQGRDDAFHIAKRVAQGTSRHDAVYERPFVLTFIHCDGVHVSGLNLRNSAYWMQNYLDCDNVLIEGLTVRSRVNGNNDGIDVDGSRNVRIANCDIDTSDDALCLKASYADCERVVIENCVLRSSCNAFKCGTASMGGFRDITASNCVVYDTRLSGIALEIVDGGTMDGVIVRGFVMRTVGTPLLIRLGDRKRKWVDVKKPLPIGEIRNIIISDLVASGCGRPRFQPQSPLASSIAGLAGHPIKGVTLSNFRVSHLGGGTAELAKLEKSNIPEAAKGYPEFDQFGDLPCYGLYCRHVDGLTLRDLEFNVATPDARPALLLDDVPGLRLGGVFDRQKEVTAVAPNP